MEGKSAVEMIIKRDQQEGYHIKGDKNFERLVA